MMLLTGNHLAGLTSTHFPNGACVHKFDGHKEVYPTYYAAGKKKRQYHEWEEHFQKLVQFKKNYGHCKVPKTNETKQLGKWMSIQRKEFIAGNMAPDKISIIVGSVDDNHHR
jgi:hypothetical protein